MSLMGKQIKYLSLGQLTRLRGQLTSLRNHVECELNLRLEHNRLDALTARITWLGEGNDHKMDTQWDGRAPDTSPSFRKRMAEFGYTHRGTTWYARTVTGRLWKYHRSSRQWRSEAL